VETAGGAKAERVKLGFMDLGELSDDMLGHNVFFIGKGLITADLNQMIAVRVRFDTMQSIVGAYACDPIGYYQNLCEIDDEQMKAIL
jgi:hypothetical protein